MTTPPVRFTFDTQDVTAADGQSVAAALIASGRRSWRHTRNAGAARGVFCGIGVCFDCLVTVNGKPNQRACLVEIRDGDVVVTQEGTGHDELSC